MFVRRKISISKTVKKTVKMMKNGAVAYYRVSTRKQGESGLGLESQRQIVERFVSGAKIIGEFTEVESGRKSDKERKQLAAALDMCKQTGAVLVIAKLDRLARNLEFICSLQNSGVEFIAVDAPHANKMTVQILAAVAENEREAISARVKAALGIAKQRGVILGKPENLTDSARDLGLRARVKNALNDENNRKASALIEEMMRNGSSLNAIAARLNQRGFKTRRGKQFQAVQVQRLAARITENN